jgi:hypothetical protein
MPLSPTLIDLDIHDPASELPRIPLARTRVNGALEELEDGLVDRAVPFVS